MVEDIEKVCLILEGYFLRNQDSFLGGNVEPPLEWRPESIPACRTKTCFNSIADLASIHGSARWHAILSWSESGYVKRVRIKKRLVDIKSRRALKSGLLRCHSRLQRQDRVDNTYKMTVVLAGDGARKVVSIKWESALKDRNAIESPAIHNPSECGPVALRQTRKLIEVLH